MPYGLAGTKARPTVGEPRRKSPKRRRPALAQTVRESREATTLRVGAHPLIAPLGPFCHRQRVEAYGVYIHVPLCRSRCHYCDFFSTTRPDLLADFSSLVATEVALRLPPGLPVSSVYFGGGTPTAIGVAALAETLVAVSSHARLAADVEITVETNPATVGVADLRALRMSGVNRLSIGVQSLDNEDLQFLGRRHDAVAARRAIDEARKAGFDNVGIDLIYGLPGRSPDHWSGQLQTAASLAVEHMSCYALTVAEGTALHTAVADGRVQMPDEELQRALYLTTVETLATKGYEQYEISNFARSPARRCRHNVLYWERRPYLGLGPSAHSFEGSVRSWNPPSVEVWRSRLEAGHSPAEGEEHLTAGQAAAEELMLQLRRTDGLDTAAFYARHHVDLSAIATHQIAELRRHGLLAAEAGRLRLTREGLVVADAVIATLADALPT